MLQLTILNAQGAIRQGKNDYDDAPRTCTTPAATVSF